MNTLFLVGFLLVTIRLFYLQVLQHEKFKSLAYSQYIDTEILPPKRGNILTSDGFLLAGTKTNYILYAEPQKIVSKSDLAEKLAKYFVKIDNASLTSETSESASKEGNEEISFGEYYQDISELINKELFWVGIRRGLTPENRKDILEMNLTGLGFEEEPVRYYPEQSLAAHVLGFVGSDEKGEKTGYYGIESGMNNDLKGKQGRVFQEVDSLGRPILLGEFKKLAPIEGRDIILSIDRSVQYIVEKKLEESVKKYDSVSGTVIVMNPNTGDIVALANMPSFDHENLIFDDPPVEDSATEVTTETTEKTSLRSPREYRNLGISMPYEPGSVIKPLTIAAAIDTGKVTPETTFEDKGPVWYSGKKIDNWDGKHHGVQTIIQLLQKSNNIGATLVGHQVGARDLSKYYHEFNIGSAYGIELEGEEEGSLRDYKTWTDIELANVSFGQGMSATPLQVLNAFNVFANGGYLLQPKIVTKIVDNGKVIDIPTKNIRQVISKQTADTMVMLLEKAAEGGEAKYYIKDDYKIAGKTGTAQIFIGNVYDPNKTNATFVGFLSGSRKFSMIVKLQEPHSSIYAAETAVPLWMDIADELIKYYGLPPDKLAETN